jgi:hypothetical protein
LTTIKKYCCYIFDHNDIYSKFLLHLWSEWHPFKIAVTSLNTMTSIQNFCYIFDLNDIHSKLLLHLWTQWHPFKIADTSLIWMTSIQNCCYIFEHNDSHSKLLLHTCIKISVTSLNTMISIQNFCYIQYINLFVHALETSRKASIWLTFLACLAASANQLYFYRQCIILCISCKVKKYKTTAKLYCRSKCHSNCFPWCPHLRQRYPVVVIYLSLYMYQVPGDCYLLTRLIKLNLIWITLFYSKWGYGV